MKNNRIYESDKLNTSIYIYRNIYTSVSKLPDDNLLPTIKYAPYTHASVDTEFLSHVEDTRSKPEGFARWSRSA